MRVNTQYQYDNMRDRIWTEEELKELILFTQSLRQENEELNAKLVAMNAYVKNGDSKIRLQQNYIKQLEAMIASLNQINFN